MLVLLSALLFATTGTSRALGPDADDVSVGLIRVAVGGLTLGAVALVLRRRTPSITDARRSTNARGWLPAVMVGALGVLLYQPMFFAGTRLTGVAIGTVLALGSAPVFTGLLDAVVRGNRPGRVWLLSTAVAIGGLMVLVAAGGNGGASVSPLGAGACLAAGFGYAVYASAAKSLLDRAWTPVATMGSMFGAAAVVATLALVSSTVLPGAISTDLGWLRAPDGWLLAGWLGLVTVTIAYILYARGLRTMSAATAATLTLAEPVAATLLGVAVLGEQPSLGAWAGLVLIGCGLAILVTDTMRSRDSGSLAPPADATAAAGTATPIPLPTSPEHGATGGHR